METKGCWDLSTGWHEQECEEAVLGKIYFILQTEDLSQCFV